MRSRVVLTVVIEPFTCANCGVAFGLEARYERAQREDRKAWYCPNGHSQWFPGQDIHEELREAQARLNDVRAERDRLAGDNMTLAQKNRRLGSRAKAGVCAFCNRSFQNVKRHMDGQHKEQKA